MSSYDPYSIVFLPGKVVDFNGQRPASHPSRENLNTLAVYKGGDNHGFFKFSDHRHYMLRRFIFEHGGSASWSLRLHTTHLGPVKYVELANNTEYTDDIVLIDFNMIMAPTDYLVLVSTGVATIPVAEVVGYPQNPLSYEFGGR